MRQAAWFWSSAKNRRSRCGYPSATVLLAAWQAFRSRSSKLSLGHDELAVCVQHGSMIHGVYEAERTKAKIYTALVSSDVRSTEKRLSSKFGIGIFLITSNLNLVELTHNDPMLARFMTSLGHVPPDLHARLTSLRLRVVLASPAFHEISPFWCLIRSCHFSRYKVSVSPRAFIKCSILL